MLTVAVAAFLVIFLKTLRLYAPRAFFATSIFTASSKSSMSVAVLVAPLAVKEITQKIIDVWGNGVVVEKECLDKHEATLLHLNNEKSREKLGIVPILTTNEAILQTTKWYKAFYAKNNDMKQISLQQIDEFEQLAKQ